jgi:UDP-2,4-diacetamido-2,4,6-trideoxy-beta-L-altropyranose hydrolase
VQDTSGDRVDPPDVLVVADAGPTVGLGHVVRCAAIAVGLQARGVRCRCVAIGAREPPASALHWESIADAQALPHCSPAVLLLDTYLLEPDRVRVLTGAQRMAVMHDEGPLAAEAALIITTDPAVAGTADTVVGGPAMSCLGPSFWGLPPSRSLNDRVRRILLTTGGGDPGGRAAGLAMAVADALAEGVVTLVRGPQAGFPDPPGVVVLDRPRSLLYPLLSSDLVITGGGNSLLEALAAGTPTIALPLASNQRPSVELLARAGATEIVEQGEIGSVVSAALRLVDDRPERERRARRGREFIDGHGALRVAFLISQLIG